MGLVACTASRTSAQVSGSTPLEQDPTAPADPTPLPAKIPTDTFQPPILNPTPFLPLTPTPSATPTPTPLACWHQAGSVESGSLSTNLLPLPLDYFIYLPPCYDQQPERRYPVLYMIHGQNYNNDQWLRLGIAETTDALVAEGKISPFIIVMPRDRSWAQPTEDNFGQAIIQYLIPEIDRDYRTLTDRSDRSIGGLSRGAGWAVHLGLSHWELFGAIGAHSLPVFWTDTSHIRAWLDAIPPEDLPRIYMDTGEKDYLIRSTLWFENILNQKDIPHEWYIFSGYHEEAYWHAHLEQYLLWYARNW